MKEFSQEQCCRNLDFPLGQRTFSSSERPGNKWKNVRITQCLSFITESYMCVCACVSFVRQTFEVLGAFALVIWSAFAWPGFCLTLCSVFPPTSHQNSSKEHISGFWFWGGDILLPCLISTRALHRSASSHGRPFLVTGSSLMTLALPLCILPQHCPSQGKFGSLRMMKSALSKRSPFLSQVWGVAWRLGIGTPISKPSKIARLGCSVRSSKEERIDQV